MSPFNMLFQEEDVLKGSFISICISITDGKMFLKNGLFESVKLSEHFSVFLFYMIQ